MDLISLHPNFKDPPLESITTDAEAIMHHDRTDILEDLLTLHLPIRSSSTFTTYVDLSVDLPLLDQKYIYNLVLLLDLINSNT